MNRLYMFIPALLFVVTSATGQTIKSNGKPTENVVVQYEKLVESGAFLTSEGWCRAAKLYAESPMFPAQGEISLMGTGGAVGENWVRNGKAEVETKWTDYYGTIDSALRYRRPNRPPPFDVPVTMTGYIFSLVYTNKHREIGKNGQILREVIGPWEWKMQEPRMTRWTTVDQAIAYVALMRDKIDDPVIKKNADKTIAALKRLRPCGNASAC
jgi:hypothetical protein